MGDSLSLSNKCDVKKLNFTQMGKIILCLAQLVGGCTLYISRVCLAIVLFLSLPTIVGGPTQGFVEFLVFYLMIISYFFLAWIWPAKSLLHVLNEKSPVVRPKSNKGLTWIASALVHSFILLGILVHLNTEPVFLVLTGLVLFTLQLVVWLAYIGVCSSTESQPPIEANVDVQPQQVIEMESETCTRNRERILRRTERRTRSQEERPTGGLTVQSLIVDIPDGAAHQDLPPSYNEVVASQMIIEKDCAAADHDEDDGDGDGDHDDTETKPPRYSQLNLHLA